MVEVRAIRDDELGDWVGQMQLGFHIQRPAEPGAAYRRDVLHQDLDRTLGAVDGERLVGTLWSFPTQLTLPGGGQVSAAAISAVTVRPTHRRRGVLRQLLTADLRAALDRGETASVLIAAEYPIYGRFGYGPATYQAEYTLTRAAAAAFSRAAPGGSDPVEPPMRSGMIEPATSRGTVELVEPATLLPLAPSLFESFRVQHAGQIQRSAETWEARLGLRETPYAGESKPPRCVLYCNSQGAAEGYLLYEVDGTFENHVPAARLELVELVAVTDDAYRRLWQYTTEVDLVTTISASMRRLDEPLAWLLDNPRVALRQTVTDFLWLRPHDVPHTLASRRYRGEGRLVLEAYDPLRLSGGRFVLEASAGGATCRATTEAADLVFDLTTLGAIVLGGTSLRTLQTAGRVDELVVGAVSQADALFHTPTAPWCSTFF